MNNQLRKRMIWEITFIFATVLIFRGIWTLMDTISFFNSKIFLGYGILIGVGVSALALYRIHCCRGSIL